MKGWTIFKHSVLLVLRNWREALQIGLVPVLAAIAAFALLVLPIVTSAESGATPGVGALLAFLLAMLFASAMMLNVIVSWHRFVLLEEYPQGWLPTWQGGRVLGYFGRLLLLVLLGVVLMIPVLIVLGLFGGILGAAGSADAGAALMVLLLAPIYVLALIAYYRLALILPSGAIDQPITLGQAWDATRGSMGVIFVMLLIFFVATAGVQLLVAALAAVSALLGGLVSTAFSVFSGIVSVSVLTTLYGHYVEGRPID